MLESLMRPRETPGPGLGLSGHQMPSGRGRGHCLVSGPAQCEEEQDGQPGVTRQLRGSRRNTVHNPQRKSKTRRIGPLEQEVTKKTDWHNNLSKSAV